MNRLCALLAGLLLCGPAFAGGKSGVDGTLDVSAAGPAIVSSTTAEACHIFKVGKGVFYGVSGIAGQAEYIYVFDSATQPADGAVTPMITGKAAGAGFWALGYFWTVPFKNGLVVCASSAGPLSLTALATGNTFAAQVEP